MSEPPATPPRRQVAELWSDGLGRAGIRSVQALAVGALVWAVVWVLLRIPLVVIPVVVAAILACAIAPLVRWLHAHGWPRALAVLSSFVAILAVFGGIITGIVFLVRAQAHELAERFTAGLEQLHSFLNNGPARISDDEQIAQARDSIQHFFTSGSVGAEALTGARTAGEIVTSLILMAVILFFFLKDGRQILEFLLWFMPPSHRDRARLAADRSALVLGGYVRGTVMVAAADAVIVGIGLQVLGVPCAAPGRVRLHRRVHPDPGRDPRGVPRRGHRPDLQRAGGGARRTDRGPGREPDRAPPPQPLLMGRVLSIHGLAILLALASGTVLAGIIGALLAVPVTAVAWTVIKTWTGRGESADGPPLSGSSWDASPAE
ncbi:AI-2E family transporter [Sinomonas flava]|uniref:AI-2E family transporter n=1 Tax=Sinomonas flava TaxID=496857 RepID=UPI0039A4E841